MGCSTTGSVIHPQQIQDTLYGVLRIHLVGGLIEKELNSPNSQVTALCKMSNQEFKSKPWTRASFTNINEVYEFMVNSRHQKYGRSLHIQLIESGLFSQNTVGVGLADLQLIIRERKRENFKIYLTKERSIVGWIQLQALFQQFPTFPITLLFDSVLVRRKPSSLGDLQCRIRTTIGQQVLLSNFSPDKQDQPPSWKNEKFTFHILKGIIRQGKIQVLHNDKEIGVLRLNIEQIEESSESQIQISQQFYYGDKIIAGTIKFFISKGDDINSASLQMKKSVFISPSKKKLPPLNAHFKTNQVFTNQLTKYNPKNTHEDKKVVEESQLQNQLDHQSQNSEKKEIQIESKFHQHQIQAIPIIIKEKNMNDENRKQNEEEQLQRQIKQEAFQIKLRQEQSKRLKLIKEEEQKQQLQAQFRISEMNRKLKQQEDQKILQEEEKKIKQLEKIKLKEEEDKLIILRQEQNRMKLLAEEKRIKKIQEQARKQEENRKKIQDEEKILKQLQAKKILEEEIKKKADLQAQIKRKLEQQQQQYRKNEQLKLFQANRKQQQLKKLQEEQQARLKQIQREDIRAKDFLQSIKEQQDKEKYEKQQKEQKLRISLSQEKQLQRQQQQNTKVEGKKILEQSKIQQQDQKIQQINQPSKIRDERQKFKEEYEIIEKTSQRKVQELQERPLLKDMPVSQINQISNLEGPETKLDNSHLRHKSQKHEIISTQSMRPVINNQNHNSIPITEVKIPQSGASNMDQNSNSILVLNKHDQKLLPNGRQHSRLLLESAVLENQSDNQSDK